MLRRKEHPAWSTAILELAGKGFWQSKTAVDQEKHDSAWFACDPKIDGATLFEHFGGIFNKHDVQLVARRFQAIKLCKMSLLARAAAVTVEDCS